MLYILFSLFSSFPVRNFLDQLHHSVTGTPAGVIGTAAGVMARCDHVTHHVDSSCAPGRLRLCATASNACLILF